MSTRRITISVSPETEEAIKKAAEIASMPLSEWLSKAVQDQASREVKVAEGRRAWSETIAEYEEDFGPIPEQERIRARRALAAHGLVADEEAATGT